MTKADLIARIANNSDLTKKDVASVVNQFLTELKDSLNDNKRIEIRGFGSFSVMERNSHEISDPRMIESKHMPKRHVPVFKQVYKGSSSNSSKGDQEPDMLVKFPTGRKWVVEVKHESENIPKAFINNLKKTAEKEGALPVIASITPHGIEYKSAKSGRKLTFSESKS